jgi:tetratricopeptide (TPR) repeat protein
MKLIGAALAILVTFGAIESRAATPLACDDTVPPEQAIVACDRMIATGKLPKAQLRAALSFRARAYMKTGATDKAIADISQWIKLEPGSARAYYFRSAAWRQKGDSDKAIADLTAAIGIDRDFAEAYNNRGLVYLGRGEADSAIADFTRATDLKPELAEAYSNRALAWRRKSDYDRAIVDFTRAVEANPKLVDAWLGRGVSHGEQGDYDAAIADYNAVIEIDPRSADAFNNRADAYLKKGEPSRAIADLNRSIDLNPALPEAYYTRGDAYYALRDYARATADLEKAMALDTKGLNHTFAKGLLAAIAGDAASPEVPATPAVDERRVALVIGNGAYRSVTRLDNPPNDAETIAETLRRTGFDSVTVAHDVDRAAFVGALKTFAAEADTADWAVVYYAGHGLEVAGTNYLIPVDAELASDRDVTDEAISLDRVMATVEGARKMRLIILDACRNNPFASRMKVSSASRAVGRGLALVEPSQATLVAFAAKAGSIASDGDAANSPFASALASHLAAPGIEINKLFRLVRADVLAATGNSQEPFIYGSLPPDDFYFVPPN